MSGIRESSAHELILYFYSWRDLRFSIGKYSKGTKRPFDREKVYLYYIYRWWVMDESKPALEIPIGYM